MGALEQALRLIEKADPKKMLPSCLIREIDISEYALSTVADVVDNYLPAGSKVAVIVDSTKILREKHDVKKFVHELLSQKFEVTYIELSDGHTELHASEAVIADATLQSQECSGIVSIGGGTITDIAKMTSCALNNIPHIVIQTVASVDGFTDNVSVIQKNGVKRTVPSRWPEAILADTRLVAQAPGAMNRAGYGEINSMFTAPADWRVAALLGFEKNFHWGPIELLRGVGRGIEEWAPGLKGSDPQSIEKLVTALAIRGIVTGVAGTTACLSGIEHIVSHMLDMHQTAHSLQVGQHGAQVGVGSIVAACVWEVIFEELPKLHSCEFPVIDEAFLKNKTFTAFHNLDPSDQIAQECWQDYQKKIQWWQENEVAINSVLRDWSEISNELRTLIKTPEEIVSGLVSAGSPALFKDLDPPISDDVAYWSIENAHLMRNRFVGTDLLEFLGLWDKAQINRVQIRMKQAIERAGKNYE